MKLDRLAIELRPRQGWEAIDLGFRMAMRWARPLWAMWFAIMLPLALALYLAVQADPWLFTLLIWWLKPVYDRFLLHVLSRAVFGEVPRLRDSLAAWREILSPGLLLGQITRFWDFSRSFCLPVLQLERQTGAPARARRRLLKQRAGGHAVGLTVVMLHFEIVVLYGLMTLGTLFATDVQWNAAPSSEGSFLTNIDNWWTWTEALLYLAAISLLQPFYVAGGFALYLNRRVLLEGWDVEVALRRLSQRHAAQQERSALPGRHLPVLILTLLLAQSFTLPLRAETPAQADVPAAVEESEASVAEESGATEESRPAANADGDYVPQDTEARQRILEILDDPVFGDRREEWRWRRIEEDKPEDPVTPRDFSTIGALVHALGEVLQVIAYVAVAGLLVALVVMLWRQRGSAGSVATVAPPAVLFGLAINPESLPADIPAAARAALAAGQWRDALSLLYRGALSHLVHQRGLRIARGATEGDVLRLAERSLPAQPVAYFRDLLALWVATAYGGRQPAPEAIEALCQRHADSLHLTPTLASRLEAA